MVKDNRNDGEYKNDKINEYNYRVSITLIIKNMDSKGIPFHKKTVYWEDVSSYFIITYKDKVIKPFYSSFILNNRNDFSLHLHFLF